jgi:tRNA pseudouridine65 synthase
LDMSTILLHASELKFKHPVTGEIVALTTDIGNEFRRVKQLMSW